jgi:hypothetical protein
VRLPAQRNLPQARRAKAAGENYQHLGGGDLKLNFLIKNSNSNNYQHFGQF